ncbi:hypothetical protein Bbelb_200520 [Branchiostoma belcheri]|nr:hypothetical protein Bbelb_200520 [Branchiostoma belcheri]
MENIITSTSDDNPKGHDGEKDDTNTPAQMDDTQNKHTTDIEDGGAFPVPVGRNIIGLVDNMMYANDSTQQAGHSEPTQDGGTETVATEDYDYDYDSDSHVYHYADGDDINNVPQSDVGNGNGGHPDDKGEDTTVPKNPRRGASDLRNNPVYDLGALSQDNNKESTCFTFLRPYLLRGIIIAAVAAALISVVAVIVIYLTHPLDNSKNLTMESLSGAYGLDLTTTSSLVNMTTTPQVELNTSSIHAFLLPATSVTRGMDDVTNKSSPTMRASTRSDGCQVGYKRLASTCFRLHFRRMTWMKAKEACKKEGARLAMPKTEELDIALRHLVRTEGQNMGYWIGLKDKERLIWKKRWGWDDGSKLGKYKGWNPGQPSSIRKLRPGKMCVRYWSGPAGYPMWDDRRCGESRKFICQTSLTA